MRPSLSHSARLLGRALLCVASLSIALLGMPTQPVSASCPAPLITVAPATGTPGSAFVVKGQYFFNGCNDVGINGQQPPPPPPTTGIVVSFEQEGRTWTLGSVDAGSDYTFTFPTTVPLGAMVGAAVIRANTTADFVVAQLRPAVPRHRQPSVTG